MANEAYAVARAELATLVSPRAAERMLDAALASAAVTPDRVTPRQMRALITGPIQNDLRSILPHGGLTVVLGALTERLRTMGTPAPDLPPATEPSPSQAGTPQTPAPPSADHPPTTDTPGSTSHPSGVLASGPEVAPLDGGSATGDMAPGASDADASATTGRAAGAGAAVAERRVGVAPAPERTHLAVPTTPPAAAVAPAPLLEAELDDEALQRIALTFARLPHVTGVAIVRAGQVAFARGMGLDAERAAVLVPAAAGVLRRNGAWRSYALTHDRGQLFIVPVGRSHIVLAGRSQFNLGAVMTALETLEEAI